MTDSKMRNFNELPPLVAGVFAHWLAVQGRWKPGQTTFSDEDYDYYQWYCKAFQEKPTRKRAKR